MSRNTSAGPVTPTPETDERVVLTHMLRGEPDHAYTASELAAACELPYVRTLGALERLANPDSPAEDAGAVRAIRRERKRVTRRARPDTYVLSTKGRKLL